MTQFAVIHVTKGSGNGSALGNHIDRIETLTPEGKTKNNFNNADPERLHLNREFVQDKYKNLSLARAVSLRISEGYNSRTKAGDLKQIAKGAVKFVEVNLSGSHEKMKELEKEPEQMQKWLQANYDFVIAKYGKENIVRFSLHLDETTPHIHCVFVPLTSDGRLSAKEIIGNNAALKNLQDDYAAAMKPFGLERGVEGSLARHTGKTDYVRKQNDSIKEIEKLTVKGIFGIDKDKTIENLKSSLIDAKTRLKMNEESKKGIQKSVSTYKNQISSGQRENLKLKIQIEKLEGTIEKHQENETNFIKKANDIVKDIVTNPHKLNELQQAYKTEEEKEKKLKWEKMKAYAESEKLKSTEKEKEQEIKKGRGRKM